MKNEILLFLCVPCLVNEVPLLSESSFPVISTKNLLKQVFVEMLKCYIKSGLTAITPNP